MINQQIYHVYFGHDGREYRELGHSHQVPDRVVETAVKLCESGIGTPSGLLANRSILLSYPDKMTGFLYMICCSPTTDFSNRQTLFYHVLTCSLDAAKEYGVNAFSLFESGCFVTNYKPGAELETVPLSCKAQTFIPDKSPFFLDLEEKQKPVVIKADQPAQLVRNLLTDETVNLLKWAEYSYKKLPDFDLYVMANPNLFSTDYVVRDVSGKILSNQERLNLPEKPTIVKPDLPSTTSKFSSNEPNKKNSFFADIITYAMILALTLLISYTTISVVKEINAIKKDIASIKNRFDSTDNDLDSKIKEVRESIDKKSDCSQVKELESKIHDINVRINELEKVLKSHIESSKKHPANYISVTIEYQLVHNQNSSFPFYNHNVTSRPDESWKSFQFQLNNGKQEFKIDKIKYSISVWDLNNVQKIELNQILSYKKALDRDNEGIYSCSHNNNTLRIKIISFECRS